MSIGSDLLHVPMGAMIQQMALAIAEAQLALDLESIQTAQLLAGKSADGKESDDSKVTFLNESTSLLELGFSPTFYQFVDTIIEVKIAITVTRETTETSTEKGLKLRLKDRMTGSGLGVSSVNATYASKYNYSAEGASLLRTKLVPVPPPALLEERLRAAK